MKDWIEAARASWRWRGEERPPFALEPGPGQESVWDYPRPPAVEAVPEIVRVELDGRILAESRRAVRVLETASAPAIYLPETDADMTSMRREERGGVCEWKGPWVFWSIEAAERSIPEAAWSYVDPWPGYEKLAGTLGFYPGWGSTRSSPSQQSSTRPG